MNREGELRLCKKVGEEKEEVVFDTAEVVNEPVSQKNTIDEEIQKIIQKPSLEGIPEVKLSEEETRKTTIEF